MRGPLLLPAALLLFPLAAAAADGGITAMSFGDGGGYKHPDPATQQFLDGASHPAAAPAASAPVAAAQPAPVPAAPAIAATPAAPAPAKTAAAAPAGRTLWNGVVRPLDVPVPSDDADAARADADRDYETRVLGMSAGPRRPSVAFPAGAAASAAAPAAAAAATPRLGAAKRLFVSLEIDPREAGDLRDAVAGLGAAGFAADARFEPLLGPGGVARVSGWMPAARLADALRRPGVRSVSIAAARPVAVPATSAAFLVGLRVDDPARARETVESGLRDLSSAAGFRATRVVGLETAPDGRSVALIEGRMPLARLAEAMDLPDVVRVAPLPPAAAAAPAPETAERSGLLGFARYSFQRGLWLIALTLALSLPSLRAGLGRLAEVFNPYRYR
jgi:hypothetical protein